MQPLLNLYLFTFLGPLFIVFISHFILFTSLFFYSIIQIVISALFCEFKGRNTEVNKEVNA